MQGGKLDGLDLAPGVPADYRSLEHAIDGFGQRVVIEPYDAANGGLESGFGQLLSVATTA